MKHVYTLALLLIFAASSVNAQDCRNATSLLKTGPGLLASFKSSDNSNSCAAGLSSAQKPFYSSLGEIWQDNDWTLQSNKELEYNENDQKTREINFRWDADSQVFVEKDDWNYTYDAAGNLSEIIGRTWNGTAFENRQRRVQQIDSFGNEISSELSNWENGAWTQVYQSFSTVQNGRVTQNTFKTLFPSGAVATSFQVSFEYDDQGRKTQELQQQWNASTNSWDLYSRQLTSYTASQKTEIYQIYSEGWVDGYESVETFNNEGQIIESTLISFESARDAMRVLFSYNASGVATKLVVQGMNELEEWVNVSQSILTLDQDNDPIELLDQSFDSDGQIWVNIHRTTVGYDGGEKATAVEEELIPGLASFDIYPYPANDHVHVELQLEDTADLQVDVFDVLGRSVVNLAKGMAPAGVKRITWSPKDEPAGLYFVRYAVDGVIATKPLVLVK